MAKERKSFFGATEELERLQDELFGAVPVTEETLIDISKINTLIDDVNYLKDIQKNFLKLIIKKRYEAFFYE